VFSGLDLEVAQGEVLAVLGDIGAGKSTVLRVLAGQVAPSSGTVRVLGLAPEDPALARDVVLAAGEPEWEPGAGVLQVLELARMAADVDDENWPLPARVCEAFGLEPRERDLPFTLSQGLRQRLALAAALCRPSRILLIDDPEFGLDAGFRPVLAEILLGYAARGGTVVLATHDLDLAVATKARTVALD
jgi:ABC-type multidrug transport system ATPase subunit